MPEHLESLGVAEYFVGPEAHVEGGYFSYLEVPRYLAVLAHPFGMIGSIRHLHVTAGTVFRDKAVVGLHTEGHAPVHLDFLPAEEAVKLRRVLAPGTGLDHQVGRFLRLPGNLAENWLLTTQGGVAQEEFNEERFGLAGLGVMGGE